MWEMILVSICQSHYMSYAQAYMKIYCTVYLHTLTLWAELEKWKVASTIQNTHPWRYAREDKWNWKQNKYTTKYPCSSYCIFSGSVQLIHRPDIIRFCKPWIMFWGDVIERSLTMVLNYILWVEFLCDCNVFQIILIACFFVCLFLDKSDNPGSNMYCCLPHCCCFFLQTPPRLPTPKTKKTYKSSNADGFKG